jgi:hypothetical protein
MAESNQSTNSRETGVQTMSDTLCGVCRQPVEEYGYWCGEPICKSCHQKLIDNGYDPVTTQE